MVYGSSNGYSGVSAPVKMSSVSRTGARLAVWSIFDARYPIVISAFDEPMGRAITDDFGDVFAVPFPRIPNFKGDSE